MKRDQMRRPSRRGNNPGYWPSDKLGIDEVIFEFTPRGAYVRVSAMHPASLTEVVAIGAASASESDLRRLALRKLERVMEKNASDNGHRGQRR